MFRSQSPTVAAWKWCAMGCLCSGAPSWRWTPRWCLPCVPTGNPGAAVLWRMGQLCRVHVDGRLALTRNCVVHTVALAWLFSPPRPEAVGQKRHTVSCPSWPKQRRGQFPTSCVVALARLGSTGGRRCSLVRLPVHSPCPCWTVVPLVVLTGQLPPRPWFSLRAAICRWGLRREVVL